MTAKEKLCYNRGEVMEMNVTSKIIPERLAKTACMIMKFFCYFAIAFYLLGFVLSLMGRQSFTVHTNEGAYEVIYAQENYEVPAEGMKVSTGDQIYVQRNAQGRIDGMTQAGLSLMYAVHALPIGVSLWFLSRVCVNVSGGVIFTRKNAQYLFYYGLTQCFAALAVPFIKLLICGAVNQFTTSSVFVATGQDLWNILIPGVAFVIAAYIIDYGAQLQDEVDHTL